MDKLMESQQRIGWNLKGRSAVAALDPATRHRITQSHAMTRCLHKPLLATLEELIGVPHIAGLVGPLQRPEPFICLIVRLLQITPEPPIVMAMLRQDVHKYLRVAALFMIRLIGNTAMIREALRIGWEDYRKIRVYASVNDWAKPNATDTQTGKESREEEEEKDASLVSAPSYRIMCVDEITDRLFNITSKGLDTDVGGGVWLGIHFSPLLIL